MSENKRNELLKFLVYKGITLEEALEILEKSKKLKESWKAQEKGILPAYETR